MARALATAAVAGSWLVVQSPAPQLEPCRSSAGDVLPVRTCVVTASAVRPCLTRGT
jgi:hypothetical protein